MILSPTIHVEHDEETETFVLTVDALTRSLTEYSLKNGYLKTGFQQWD